MAATVEAAHLTERHRQAQLQVRARAVRDYMLLWPTWRDGDEGSLMAMLQAAYVLVTGYHRLSSLLGVSYYRAYRRAEGIEGQPTPRVAAPPYEGEVIGTLRLTGDQMRRKAIRAGQLPEQAERAAQVRTSGTVSRLTLAGGRDTVILSTAEDKQAQGWARVTDSDPCSFCLTLASRGAVYKADTVGFRAHDHCGCGISAVYPGDRQPQADRHRETYNAAVREAKAAGEFKRGTENDSINAVRRYLNAK